MSFNDIKGHDRLKEILIEEWRQNKLHHAYLFTGKEGIGKKLLSIEVAKILNCDSEEKFQRGDSCGVCRNCRLISKRQHPDLRIVTDKENKLSIGVDTIREVKEFVGLKPYMGNYKVIIVDDAHTLTAQAQNGLLKTLEEPPLDTIIFLITHKEYVLLPTIISRTQRMVFSPLNFNEVKEILFEKYKDEDKVLLEIVSIISQGSPGKAMSFIENGGRLLLEEATCIIDYILNREIEEAFFIGEELYNAKWTRDKIRLLLELVFIILFETFVKNDTLILRLIEEYLKIELKLKPDYINKEKFIGIAKLLNSEIISLEFSTVNWRLLLENSLITIKSMLEGGVKDGTQ